MQPHDYRSLFDLLGRRVPKIVPVKGAVVHRAKLSEVPQGKLDE